MIGPAVVLVLATLTLLAAGITVVVLVWRGAEHRESHFLLESRQMDAALQQSAQTVLRAAPEWMRLNLRDGRVLLAEAFADARRQGYRVAFVSPEAPPALPEDAEPDWVVERALMEDGLAEAVAISDGRGTRIGSVTPSESDRGLTGPQVFEARLHAGRPYRLGPGTIDRDGEPVAGLFPGPYPRVGLLQWRGEAAEPGEVRDEAALLALVGRWTGRLRLYAMLKRAP